MVGDVGRSKVQHAAGGPEEDLLDGGRSAGVSPCKGSWELKEVAGCSAASLGEGSMAPG